MQRQTFYPPTGKRTAPALINWNGYDLNDSLFYSYRDTVYDRSTYPADLHYHEYYELVVFLEGDVRYVCESSLYTPKYGDVILVPPGRLHMSLLRGESTRYRRHVFYMLPTAFDAFGCGALSELLTNASRASVLSLPSGESVRELTELLQRLTRTLEEASEPMERALGWAYILRIFYLLNRRSIPSGDSEQALPEAIRRVKEYVDEHIAELSSVGEVASALFYSREHVSRSFKRYFNTTVSEYIRKRRIAVSRELIAQGVPLIDVCYRVGFGNMSTFIRSFSAITGMCPSEYREMIRG